ncbi:MAG TPA: DUF488 family protein [Xanthobacteraceae bacterium]|jgi:uncharacterized protein YeaO (DUF488 family)|nr:DUF488 family protein [Xanthobacteraceae bacterium]
MPAKRAPTKAAALRIKRIYQPAAKTDGLRVLVDRLWPRGIAKAKAQIDLWLKDVSPSDALRHKFHNHPESWSAFVTAYRRELKQEPASSALDQLRALVRKQPVTLLYAARDETHNNAVALQRLLATSKQK